MNQWITRPRRIQCVRIFAMHRQSVSRHKHVMSVDCSGGNHPDIIAICRWPLADTRWTNGVRWVGGEREKNMTNAWHHGHIKHEHIYNYKYTRTWPLLNPTPQTVILDSGKSRKNRLPVSKILANDKKTTRGIGMGRFLCIGKGGN